MINNEGLLDELKKKYDEIFGSDDVESADIDEDCGSSDFDNVIVLNDELGNEVEFEFLDLIEYEGEEYVVLLPKEKHADEVVILRLEESDNSDEESYASVDDEKTLDIIFAIFKEKFKNDFNFID